MANKVQTQLTFAGHVIDIGYKNPQQLLEFISLSPPFEKVKEFVEKTYRDVRITKSTEQQPEIPKTISIPPRQVEWKEKPEPTGEVPFPKLPELSPELISTYNIATEDVIGREKKSEDMVVEELRTEDQKSTKVQDEYCVALLARAREVVEKVLEKEVQDQHIAPLREAIQKYSDVCENYSVGSQTRNEAQKALENLLKKYITEYNL